MAKKTTKSMFREIDLGSIDRPDDIVRLKIDDDELRELAESILERGLMQPIGVTPRGNRFMIVFGDRRYLAHELLGLKKIMCRIEEIENNQVMIDRAMENVQRVDLTPFEEGNIYAGLIEKAGMSLEEISRRVGKSPGIVHRRMDILRMPESFQKALHAGSIGVTVAEELWSCPDQAKREYFLDMAVEHGVTRDVARDWVSEFKRSKRGKAGASGDIGSLAPVYEDLPIYRGCDICKGPVEYKDLKELRVCSGCYKSIVEVLKGDR